MYLFTLNWLATSWNLSLSKKYWFCWGSSMALFSSSSISFWTICWANIWSCWEGLFSSIWPLKQTRNCFKFSNIVNSASCLSKNLNSHCFSTKIWSRFVKLLAFNYGTNVHLLILQKAGFITCIKNSNRSREWLNGYQLTVIWFTMVVPLSILQSNGGPQSGSVNPHTDWRHV